MRRLLVPGRGVPRPEHWLNRWATQPSYEWAPYPPGPPFVLDDRVAVLHSVVAASDEDVVLVAHSAGCLTTVFWSARHTGPVVGALLVTPPYIDPEWTPGPDDPPDATPWIVPREALPFRSVLVASRTDPYTSFAQFEEYAADWGSELFDAGDVGHLDTKSGFGPWPEGERLVADLG